MVAILQTEPMNYTEIYADRGSDFAPLGMTGIIEYNGVLYDETRHELRGQQWYRIVREMMLSPVIRGMLFAVEMLARQAEWHIIPAEGERIDPDEAQRMADFVEQCRFDMRTTWEDTLASVLSFLPYGFSVFEVIYKRRLGTGTDQPSTFDDGLIGWDDWSPRLQHTLVGWTFDKRGHPVAVKQQGPNSSIIEIPLNRCLHFRAGGYRGSPEGESVLRAAYFDWDAIRKLQVIEAIGIERDLAGLPVAFIEPKYLRQEGRSASETAVYEEVKKIVTRVRQNNMAGVVFPMAYDPSGKPLFDFKLMSSGGARQFDTGAVISRRTTHMTMAMLADFLTVGHGATGSYALSQDKTRLFTTAIAAWLDAVANVINDQAIKPLMRVNGLDDEYAPMLRPGSMDEADLAKVGGFVTQLMPMITANLNKEDQLSLMQHLFDVADFPAISTSMEDIDDDAVDETVKPITEAPVEDENAGITLA